MIRLLTALLLLLLVGVEPAYPKKLTYRLNKVSVVDADTISFSTGKKTVKLRLKDIDAPERDQPWGSPAYNFTCAFVDSDEITIVADGKDRYGRLIGTVEVKGKGLGLALVERDLAWVWCPSRDVQLWDAQDRAKERYLGLWQDSDAIEPWNWRALRKMKHCDCRPATLK